MENEPQKEPLWVKIVLLFVFDIPKLIGFLIEQILGWGCMLTVLGFILALVMLFVGIFLEAAGVHRKQEFYSYEYFSTYQTDFCEGHTCSNPVPITGSSKFCFKIVQDDLFLIYPTFDC